MLAAGRDLKRQQLEVFGFTQVDSSILGVVKGRKGWFM